MPHPAKPDVSVDASYRAYGLHINSLLLRAFDCFTRQFSNTIIIASFQRIRRNQPEPPMHSTLFRAVITVVRRGDTTSWAETHLRERARNRLQRFSTAVRFRREEFELFNP